MISWTASQRNDLLWRKIGRHCKKFSFSLGGLQRPTMCKRWSCGELDWLYHDIAMYSCFLLEACKGEQCTKYGVFQKPDHGLIVQLHIIAKGFARACKCDLSQARWRKPPPGRPAPKHVSSFKAAAAAPFYKSESKQSQDPRTHRVTSKLWEQASSSRTFKLCGWRGDLVKNLQISGNILRL